MRHLRQFLPISSVAGFALVLALALAVPAAASAAYTNPFAGATASVGRTDMGVDLCLNPGDPIRAIGDGTVIGIQRNWYAGQPYLWYELSSGAHAGDYVYVAEQIDHLARVGQTLHSGDVIARYAKHGSCLETGWSVANGETLASATTGYVEGQATSAGVSFARFLSSLGVSGQFELTAATSQAARASTHRHHGKRPTPPVPRHVPSPTPSPVPVSKPKPQPKPAPVTPVAAPSAGTPAPGGTVSAGSGQPGSGPYPQPYFGPSGNEPYWPH